MIQRPRPGAVRSAVLGLALWLAAAAASAAVQVYSGRLNDGTNAALVGSGAWTGSTPPAADFTDDLAIANNVALYTLTLAFSGSVKFVSAGFGLGGVDPYFTLFRGIGPGATVLDSNNDQAITIGGDFSLTTTLLAGSYTLALGAYSNLSLAENLGSGMLGDGFTGLGQPGMLRNYGYELTVTTPDGGTVPEPGGALLALTALVALAAAGRARQRAATHAG